MLAGRREGPCPCGILAGSALSVQRSTKSRLAIGRPSDETTGAERVARPLPTASGYGG
jgi:hypothetical protein